MIVTEKCGAPTTVTFTAPLVHLCPFRDEVDEGEVQICWDTAGQTIELHSLAEELAKLADTPISHEDVTDRIFTRLSGLDGISAVQVATRWTTAGAQVEVTRRALPGERLVAEGA